MKKIIHVNQHKIRSNWKKIQELNYIYTYDDIEPVLTCKTYKENIYGYQMKINGPSTMIYRPDKPLSCGAKIWVETHAEVEIVVGIRQVRKL
jgi:hypothetical protein